MNIKKWKVTLVRVSYLSLCAYHKAIIPMQKIKPQTSHVMQTHFKSLRYLPHLTTIAAQAASQLAKS